MNQSKPNLPPSLPVESEQVVRYLTKISAALKQQRRHFDDAVVEHCIRLINDYVKEDKLKKSDDR